MWILSHTNWAGLSAGWVGWFVILWYLLHSITVAPEPVFYLP